MTKPLASIFMLSLFSFFQMAPWLHCQDSDRDGLADTFEQELLVKFAPRFMLSQSECDGAPAEFKPDATDPSLLEKNGVIYGQVSPAASTQQAGAFLEIHYYHLWNRDCGSNGHDLDAEHISAWVGSKTISDPVTNWRAIYWYAAAHEDTLCDASQWVRAVDIDSELHGPTVWISAGKHASYLQQNFCQGGCGADSCVPASQLVSTKIVNLGERRVSMNGATWSASRRWPLAAKMETDFPEAARAKIEAANGAPVIHRDALQTPAKPVVNSAEKTADALSAAGDKTDSALAKADASGSKATGSAAKHTGRSLKRALQAVGKVLF